MLISDVIMISCSPSACTGRWWRLCSPNQPNAIQHYTLHYTTLPAPNIIIIEKNHTNSKVLLLGVEYGVRRTSLKEIEDSIILTG